MIEVRWNPQDDKAGTTSFRSWANEDLQKALRQAFHETARERLVRIDVSRDGMTAYFQSKK